MIAPVSSRHQGNPFRYWRQRRRRLRARDQGASFAFTVREGGDKWEMRGEKVIRELLDVDLHEITITPTPAYADTSVARRTLDTVIRPRPRLALARRSGNMQLDLPLISSKAERRSRCTSWDLMRSDAYGTDAGVPVSPHLVENLSAVFGAVQVISETVATLPCTVYRREGNGVREADPSHPVSLLFSRQPNEQQTAPEFIETMQSHLLLRGNT